MAGYFMCIYASNSAGHFRNRNMTENENKIDCIDSLIFGLNRTAEWRKKMAVRHPSDNRNTRANSYLLKLANEASQLNDEDWRLLQSHYGWASERFREAVSQTARLVAFQHKIKDLQSFVAHLIDVLSQTGVAA
jgi:hypothetical protein